MLNISSVYKILYNKDNHKNDMTNLWRSLFNIWTVKIYDIEYIRRIKLGVLGTFGKWSLRNRIMRLDKLFKEDLDVAFMR